MIQNPTKQPGTVYFMPPEAFEDKRQSNTSLDVFVMVELYFILSMGNIQSPQR